MTDWLEFHDSTLQAIDAGETHIRLLLDACIHRWQSLNDSRSGTGWVQSVSIVVSDPMSLTAVPLLPADISDGRLQVHGMAPNGLVRLPLQASGVVTIRLELTTGDCLELTGTAVRIEPTAAARYMEALPAILRPEHPGETAATMQTIPKHRQVAALVDGDLNRLLSEYCGSVPFDYGRYLTVTRQDLEHYLDEHPDAAQRYFVDQAKVASRTDYDCHLIEVISDRYTVSWLDHGVRKFQATFATLSMAVAEHILRTNGMKL